ISTFLRCLTHPARLFYIRCLDRGGLPLFPTRRSSDLRPEGRWFGPTVHGPRRWFCGRGGCYARCHAIPRGTSPLRSVIGVLLCGVSTGGGDEGVEEALGAFGVQLHQPFDEGPVDPVELAVFLAQPPVLFAVEHVAGDQRRLNGGDEGEDEEGAGHHGGGGDGAHADHRDAANAHLFSLKVKPGRGRCPCLGRVSAQRVRGSGPRGLRGRGGSSTGFRCSLRLVTTSPPLPPCIRSPPAIHGRGLPERPY